MKKPSFDLWYFEWMDATSVDEWTDIYELMEVHGHTIKTVGFLLNEDDENICLAMNYDGEAETASCVMYIPKSIVIKRHRVLIDAKMHVGDKRFKITDKGPSTRQ